MKVRRGLSGFDSQRGCILSIGNFDGVHLGHQSMIETLSDLGVHNDLPSVLLTFEPHPMEVLQPTAAPARLTRFKEKLSILSGMPSPLDTVVCLRFDKGLSKMPAAEFIQRVLVDGFGVRHLLVGHDFRFGHCGQGNVAQLRAAAAEHGFKFDCFTTVERQGARISSTRIRTALRAGDLSAASKLLGRPYSFCGRVHRGQQLGRQLGFPTANIHLRRNHAPLSGVFAVTVSRNSGLCYPGVANVGSRPTVGGLEERLEVYLLDFDDDLYGEELKVDFLSRLRAEKRFNGLDELSRQIQLDVQSARNFFREQSERLPS